MFQGNLEHFNYRFFLKSGNDAYDRGWGEGHVICFIMKHCIRKLICDSHLKGRWWKVLLEKIFPMFDFSTGNSVNFGVMKAANLTSNHLGCWNGRKWQSSWSFVPYPTCLVYRAPFGLTWFSFINALYGRRVSKV